MVQVEMSLLLKPFLIYVQINTNTKLQYQSVKFPPSVVKLKALSFYFQIEGCAFYQFQNQRWKENQIFCVYLVKSKIRKREQDIDANVFS